MTKAITAQFQGLDLSIIDHNGQKWLTAEQVGLALGYNPANARAGINNLYNRHADEFTEQDTCVINLMTQGQRREIRAFSATGCHLLSFFSNTPRAKAFRAWVKATLAGTLTGFKPNCRIELPIDSANTCLAQLKAIDQLVCSIPREDGMHLVNPDHFCQLLGCIIERLEASLHELSLAC